MPGIDDIFKEKWFNRTLFDESIFDEIRDYGLDPQSFLDNLEVIVAEHKPYIARFCEQYTVELLRVGISRESGKPELSYSFSDNSGYYTLQGIKESLNR